MPKWFNEDILIPYWEDRCKRYKLPDGVQILEAKRNLPLSRYPDISHNVLSTGDTVPCELEWLTTKFEKHGHDINVLKESNGFLVSFIYNASFPLPQIEIDEDDFIDWFVKNAEILARETIQEIKATAKPSKDPVVWLFYIGTRGRKDYQTAFDHGVWGFPQTKRGSIRGYKKVSQIKEGDIVVFVREISLPNSNSGSRLKADEFIGTIKEIKGVRVSRGFYEERENNIWNKKSYPSRFNFDKIMFSGEDIPCNPVDLGKSLHEIIRYLVNHGSVEKIDANSLIKIMALCK